MLGFQLLLCAFPSFLYKIETDEKTGFIGHLLRKSERPLRLWEIGFPLISQMLFKVEIYLRVCTLFCEGPSSNLWVFSFSRSKCSKIDNSATRACSNHRQL